MPELPEVETVRRGLERYVVGLTLEKVEIINPGIFEGDPRSVEGSKIIAARRSGKGLILDFNNKFSLAIHIKMTGQLIYRDEKLKDTLASPQKVGLIPNKFTHIIFKFLKPRTSKLEPRLFYNDQRRFGWIRVVPTDQIMEMPFFKSMGPEPMGLGVGGLKLTPSILGKILENKTTKVKPFIMDQSNIGGIGNIYANDALWDARIDPARPARSLNRIEVTRLFDSIIKVMELSLKEGGASEMSFVNILGQEGNYQSHTLVYGKTGKPCPRNDGGTIKRIVLGGRGTFYCPVCQK